MCSRGIGVKEEIASLGWRPPRNNIIDYGILVFVGQGVYVGATGRLRVGEAVMVGEAVRVGSGVPVPVGKGVMVGVEVAVIFPSRLKAKREAASRITITPAAPPTSQGSQSTL
jgi:hypothetical protein